jgi:DNA-binding ferritin-like protein (Dps family)
MIIYIEIEYSHCMFLHEYELLQKIIKKDFKKWLKELNRVEKLSKEINIKEAYCQRYFWDIIIEIPNNHLTNEIFNSLYSRFSKISSKHLLSYKTFEIRN